MRRAWMVLAVMGVLVAMQPSRAASISGKITNPEKCLDVQILQRRVPGEKCDPRRPRRHPATYNRKTGAFEAKGLPDGIFDVRVLIKGGMMDGVDLRPEEIEGDTHKFDDKDIKKIKDVIANMPAAFMDTMRPIFIRGKGCSARALVELIRYRGFHSGREGDLIWRMEVWKMRRHTGAWVKQQRGITQCRVRVPQEMTPGRFYPLVWIFNPDMGGIELEEDESRTGLTITIPKPGIENGKVPGSIKKQIERDRNKKAAEVTENAEERYVRPVDGTDHFGGHRSPPAVGPRIARKHIRRSPLLRTVCEAGSVRTPEGSGCRLQG